MAEIQNLWLPRLRSWATVGTPFLQQQTRSRWSLINGINIFLALILLKPAYVTFTRLVQYSIASLTGGDVQVWFDFEGEKLAGRFRSSRTPEVGAMTPLYLDMKNISLFDAQTEARL